MFNRNNRSKAICTQVSAKFRMISLGLLLACTMLLSQNVIAQAVTEDDVRSELEQRGLTEEEVTEALIAEGIDPNSFTNIQDASPQDIARIQAIITDLEAQKAAESGEEQPRQEEIAEELIDITAEQDSIQLDTVSLEEEGILRDTLVNAGKNSVYGQELFRDSNVKIFKQSDEIKAPENYILGQGDEVAISIFGKSFVEDSYEIPADGYIKIREGKKRVLLAGLTLKAAKEKLYKIYDYYYTFQKGQFQVTLSYARTISVNIYGEVFSQGTYKMNAYNNAFNGLVAAKGPNDLGSFRNIKLIKANGDTKTLDIYKLMNEPGKINEYYLEDNDNIFVPIREKLVQIKGGVKKEMFYELKENEGLEDLLKFAGGFRQDAYRKRVRVLGYEDDQKVLKDLDYNTLPKAQRNHALNDGDIVSVEFIDLVVENVVEVQGIVENPGRFERFDGMRLSDAIAKAVLRPESYLDKGFLIRTFDDGRKAYKWFSIKDALQNNGSLGNLLLENKDIITVWPQSKFVDNKSFRITGAVREPGPFTYGIYETVTLHDAIVLAGGLSRDAALKAIVKKKDPLIDAYGSYVVVDNIQEIYQNPESSFNFPLDGFDEIEIFSENDYNPEAYIVVDGNVNRPGEYAYGRKMRVSDALILAKGFTISSNTSNIEISRIVIQDNKPTETLIATLEVNKEFDQIGKGDESDFELLPYDQIIVRSVPEFELQKFVYLAGEVVYPGPYPILEDNERISSVIRRAGGLTKEAFPEGAKLRRRDRDLGNVVMRLDEALNNPRSKYNYYLKAMDTINVPKVTSIVTIKGATRVSEVLADDQYGPENSINVAYTPGKTAKYYIDNYAGGLGENASRRRVFVEHPNGQISRTRRLFIFGNQYPKVTPGSTISVGLKTVKTEEELNSQNDVDWTRVLSDAVAQATSILTLILLIQRLD